MARINGDKKLYTIGEAAKLCDVSRKTLRYYDELGIIVPDKVSEDTGYRYYSRETLMRLPKVKYYKQMGFKLHEIEDIYGSIDYHEIRFRDKIEELKENIEKMQNALKSITDWDQLIQEGCMVYHNHYNQVNVKYLSTETFCYAVLPFYYEYNDSIMNIEWVKLLESHDCEISGPVILSFSSYKDKMEGKSTSMTIMQECVSQKTGQKMPKLVRNSMMVASTYHVGDFSTCYKAYERIESWAKANGYICGPESYERYVIDYWITQDTEKFVVEVQVPLSSVSANNRIR
ncbi:MerR family transcriptional regulator [Carnobacteriaceae bacterium zg-ZUI78]|nr:MerR family transcriptional regulator [Carnobacteriaceae bacterium zg-ZUI78]